MTDIKIGDEFFKFKDIWRCRQGEDGYEVVVIKGETSRSWLVGPKDSNYGEFKVPKNKPFADRKIKTQQMVDDDRMCGKSYRIGSVVQHMKDPEKLRKILEIIGGEKALER